MDDAGGTYPLLRVLLSQNIQLSQGGSLFFDILLIFIFIFINAFFAAAEMALVTQNDNRIRKLAEEGNVKAHKLMRFVADKSRVLASIQVLITLAGFLSSAFAADKIASRLYFLADPGGQSPWLQTIFLVVVTIVLSFFALVLGEIAPKRLAMRKPEVFSLAFVSVLSFFNILLSPFTKLIDLASGLVLRLFGVDPKATPQVATEEEIRILAEAGVGSGDLQAENAFLINNIFAFDDKDAGEIMTPRLSMTAIPVSAAYDEAMDIVANANYSRFAVYENDLDNIVGVLLIKDLIRVPQAERAEGFSLAQIMRKAYFVPENKRIDVLFREMKQQHISLVIVVDEYGGTEGMVTIEDLLEEIVGEIEDEYDSPEADIVANNDGSFLLNGLLTLEEAGRHIKPLAQLKFEDDYDTVAGFVLSLLGRIPQPGERPRVDYENMVFTVWEMDDRRIAWIKLEMVEQVSDCVIKEGNV